MAGVSAATNSSTTQKDDFLEPKLLPKHNTSTNINNFSQANIFKGAIYIICIHVYNFTSHIKSIVIIFGLRCVLYISHYFKENCRFTCCHVYRRPKELSNSSNQPSICICDTSSTFTAKPFTRFSKKCLHVQHKARRF